MRSTKKKFIFNDSSHHQQQQQQKQSHQVDENFEYLNFLPKK